MSKKNLEELSNEELIEMIKGLQKSEKEKDSLIEELTQELENASSKTSSNDNVIEIGKKKYQVLIPRVRYQGKIVSVKDLQENPSILKKFEEMGVRMVEPIK